MAAIGRYVVESIHSFYGPEYTCTICQSQFDYFSEVEEHCRWDHFWCARCERVFVSEASKRDHLRNSHRHHICNLCEFAVDFPSQRDLEDHLDEQHCLCEPCKRYFPSAYELGQHDIQCHNWCNKCDRYFSNENNYRMVRPHALANATVRILTPNSTNARTTRATRNATAVTEHSGRSLPC